MSRVWHKGPPPHVGWWEASWSKTEGHWRWWNGKSWSLAALEHETAYDAAKMAGESADYRFEIMWTNYWPKNARVPRIEL